MGNFSVEDVKRLVLIGRRNEEANGMVICEEFRSLH